MRLSLVCLLAFAACRQLTALAPNEGEQDEDPPACEGVACAMNVCGDGVLLAGVEECDDGNTASEPCPFGEEGCLVCGAACTIIVGAATPCFGAACMPPVGEAPFCGDGSVDPGEACDTAGAPPPPCAYGTLSCKHCDASCKWVQDPVAYCGDGQVQGPEQCDDGNLQTEICDAGVPSCSVCDARCHLVAGETSYCGNGELEGIEACEAPTAGCAADCRALPGWSCAAGVCSERRYRFAIIHHGGLMVRDISATGAVTAVRTLDRGGLDTDPRPAWSPDGNLLTYPTADNDAQTYLYEGAGVDPEPLAWLNGHEASFGSPPTKAIVRDGDGYRVWTAQTNTESPPGLNQPLGALPAALVPGAQVRTPVFEPGSTTRFAFIDAASGALSVFTGSSTFDVSANVSRYAWHPDGGAIAFVTGAGSCALRRAVVQSASALAPVTVATQVPCDARIAYAPSAEALALSTSFELYHLLLDGQSYDVSAHEGRQYVSAGRILDLAYAPDGLFMAYLAERSATDPNVSVYLFRPGAALPLDTGITGPCLGLAISPALP